MATISNPAAEVKSKPFNGHTKREDLLQKVLVERSAAMLERMLVIGACKFREFHHRLKELDVAPRLAMGLLNNRRGDFLHPEYGRVFPLIADWRDVNESADTITAELLDMILLSLVEAGELQMEDKDRIAEWLVPELKDPEWENRVPLFAILDTTVFREWRRYAIARYEIDRLHLLTTTATETLPVREIDVALKKIQQAGKTVRSFPAIVDVADFAAKKMMPPVQLIHGLWHQAQKLSVGGASKGYKSWILYNLGIAISHGESWLGFPTTKAPVLFVNLEIPEFFSQQRIRTICEKRGIKLEHDQFDIVNLRGFAASYETLIPKILERIHERGRAYAAIILDPIYKLYPVGGDENSATDIAALMNAIEGLTLETGAGVAFGAHFSKGNQATKQAIDRISGSGVFARDPDSMIVFTTHQQEGAFTVECVARNLPPVKDFVVMWEYPIMVRESRLDPKNLKQPKGRHPVNFPEDLLVVLPDTGPGITTGEWLKDSRKTESTFKRLKKELVKSGQVIEENGLWRAKSPERPNDPNEP
jgi:hypothetical protein